MVAYATNSGMENDPLAINKAKIVITQAVIVAEQHANGKASRAEYENSEQSWVYDVEMESLNQILFLSLNALEHPGALTLMVPISLAEWFIWTVPLLIGIGWLRGSENTCKTMLVATASGLLGLFLIPKRLPDTALQRGPRIAGIGLALLGIPIAWDASTWGFTSRSINVVGTQITDLLTDGLGVSLYISTSVFAVALAAIFFVWYRVERTLSIYDIVTRSRELFYWAAILCTFALDTTAADLATEALGLGFIGGELASATYPDPPIRRCAR
ncbi:hypothetical protein [Xylella fastidiosa]|uniref:hypothetical protein n=1 Tax=Xylella fastidiosa TaxID=2371 RepID=UPI000AC62C99|nr:hypothetical protein [Xylella fastidiosa]